MLLARLEGHAECTMAFRVSRQADHASGHFPDVLLLAREDSQERTAEVHLRAERLSFSDDDVRSEVPRGTDDRLRDRIHPDDEHPFRHGANFLELFFESAEEIRVLDIDTASVRRQRGLQLREIEHPAFSVIVHFADLEACADNIVREHRPSVVPQRTRDEEDPTPVDSVRHPGRFAERRRAVVHRRVRRVHPGELADQPLILPERLEQALTDLGLVRRVRGVELGAGGDRPQACGHEVIVQASPQERGHVDDRTIRREHRGHARDDPVLRQSVGNVELRNPHGRGNVREEVVDAPQAHLPEHLVLVGGHAVSAERGAGLKGFEWVRPGGCLTESICAKQTFGAWRKRLLPRIVASLLLLLAGVWWGLAVLAWIGWEKRFASAGLRKAREGTPKKKRDWASTIVDVIQFGLPTVLAVGLAIDGLASGIVFYGYPWSFYTPFAAVIQLLGAILLFLGLPLFTAGAYLTGKYVYSKLPEERPLLQRGPYRCIRHPIYLSFLLTSVGFLLLAENIVMVPLLFALTALKYPKPEEEELIQLYGDAYREYRNRTGRFFPRLRRR